MVARLSRTAAAVLMVGLIAGAAVAFSVGVPIHSAAVCNNEISYGVVCPGNPIGGVTITIGGSSGGTVFLGANGGLLLTLNNPTDNTVLGNLTLSYFSANAATAAKLHRKVVRKSFKILPHHKLRLRVKAKGLRRGKLVIKLRDSKGNTRTITKTVKPRKGKRSAYVTVTIP